MTTVISASRCLTPLSQKVRAMFAEPQTVTVDTVAKTLPRVAFGDRRGTFQSTDDGITLSIAHAVTRGNRRRITARLDFNKKAVDPLLDGVSRMYSMSTYIVLDVPVIGYTDTETEANAKALGDWLATAGVLEKLVNGES